MSDDCLSENEMTACILLPSDIKEYLEGLQDLYDRADQIAQTLEERLLKCTQVREN